jgi:hypothetical protein
MSQPYSTILPHEPAGMSDIRSIGEKSSLHSIFDEPPQPSTKFNATTATAHQTMFLAAEGS